MASLSPQYQPIKAVALRAALEAKIYGSPTFRVYSIALISKDALELTDSRLCKAILSLTRHHTVKVLSIHDIHYVVIEMLVTIKMPTQEMAAHWAGELQRKLRRPCSISPSLLRYSGIARDLKDEGIADQHAKSAAEHRIFSFPIGLLGVSEFSDDDRPAIEKKNTDSAQGTLGDDL